MNFCSSFRRNEKIEYFGDLYEKDITTNMTQLFPLGLSYIFYIIIKGEHMILRNKKIIFDETEVANILKNIFSNIKNLKIPGYYF